MMVLNDCCSWRRAGAAWTTARNAAAKAQSFVTGASSNRAVQRRADIMVRARRVASPGIPPDAPDRRSRWRPLARARGSTAGGEEAAQQGRGLALADAAVDLGPVQAAGRGEVAHAALDRAALGIGGAVIEPPDAGERDRRRAHGAGLECDVEVAVDEPLAAERLGRAPDRHHLGMR